MRRLSKILIFITVFIFTALILTHLSNPEKETVSITSQTTLEPAAPSPSPTLLLSPSPVPADTMISDGRFADVDSIISGDISSGFPGAVLLVSLDGQIVFLKSYGNLKVYDGASLLPEPVPMRTDTVFDVASLTKVYATTLSAMKLVEQGVLSLDSHVYEFLPDFDKDEYDRITIRQLLNHTAGFPSDVKFFRPDVAEGESFYSLERDSTIALLSEVPLENEPGGKSQYSDVGYMVLGAVLEKVSGMRLDDFVRQNIYEPLGITDGISYLPLENGFSGDNIACTELMGNSRDGLVDFPGVRTYTLQGEVHDEKAYYSMGGVSGHAGLFSDAGSLDILNQMLLNEGSYNGAAIFAPETVDTFSSVYDNSIYQLGFSHAAKYNSLAGIVPEGTLCHTGWTGAFSLVDKKNSLSIVLLTNKRHSPVTDGEFEGALYETGKYYSVVTAIYMALGLN